MDLKIKINNIKNIQTCELSLPIEKGVYCLVGANGCGKSTVLSCLAQSVFSSSLQKNLSELDYTRESYVEFFYNGKSTVWHVKNGSWESDCKIDNRIHFSGMYEGSLFYGTRFADSLIIDDLVKKSIISTAQIVDADEYVKNQLSFILHGDLSDYIQSGDDNGKALYRKLVNNLEKRNITEETFVKELCNIIMRHENFKAFASELTSRISG